MMNKLYLSVGYIDKFQDNINGRNRVTVSWIIDLSKMPEIDWLADMLDKTMSRDDRHRIHPTLDYENGFDDHTTFGFRTTAWVKVNKDDKYNDVIGYQLALNKAQQKAIKVYQKLIKEIRNKVYQYYLSPFSDMEEKLYDTDKELKRNFNKKVRQFNKN